MSMFANNRRMYKNIVQGNTTQEDVPLVEMENLLLLLENILIDLTVDAEGEDNITQRLVQLAQKKQKDSLQWIFSREAVTKGSKSREDIGISPESDEHTIFLLIEAKRLDNKLPKTRDKEYILGDRGGIERFKREKHAKEYNYAGMIGYIQTDNCDIWSAKINSWIDEEIKFPTSKELTWESCEKLLEEKKTARLTKYTSNHNCISGKQIYLTHLWIRL